MRCLSLLLVSSVALADVSAPESSRPSTSPAAQGRLESSRPSTSPAAQGRLESREPPTLVYVGPADGASDGKWSFTEHKMGETTFTLDGCSAYVREVLEAGVVDGRHDRFYRADVRCGDAVSWNDKRFGATLSPLVFTTKEGVISVSFGADYKIHVRGQKGELTLDAAGQGYLSRRGGNVSADIVETSVAGLPLVKVSSHPEACADFWDVYVSFAGGVPKKALELGGIADPPVEQAATVKFEPRAHAATVTTSTTNEDGKTTRKQQRYQLRDGVFVEATKKK